MAGSGSLGPKAARICSISPRAAQGQQQLSQLPGWGGTLRRLIDRRAVHSLFQDDPVRRAKYSPAGSIAFTAS